MTNVTIGLIYIVFALLGTLAIIFALVRHKDTQASLLYILFCACNIIWAALHSLVYFLPNEQLAFLAHDLRLPFICASSVTIYLHCKAIMNNKQPRTFVGLFLYAMPLVTLLLAATNGAHHLINVEIHFDYMDGIRHVVNQNGFWFWVHCAYSYFFMALSTIFLFKQMLKMPNKYKAPSCILLAGLLLAAGSSIAAIMKITPYGVDFAPIACLIAQVVGYFVFDYHTSMNIFFSSREVIFEESDDPIFILDDADCIVDCNFKAKQLFEDIGIHKLTGLDFKAVLNMLIEKYNGHIVDEKESIFTLHEKDLDIHYQKEVRQLRNPKKRKNIGAYVTLKNISPIMTQIHKLQEAAYFDSLTGLHNRNYLNMIIEEWQEKGNLPLGVLFGDVNGLKQINDMHGHSKGDLLLLSIANIMIQYQPQHAMLTRVGGDEFVVLVENTTPGIMNTYIKNIEAGCKDLHNLDPVFKNVSIALAFGMRMDHSQTIQEVINKTDKEMYVSKFNRRAACQEQP